MSLRRVKQRFIGGGRGKVGKKIGEVAWEGVWAGAQFYCKCFSLQALFYKVGWWMKQQACAICCSQDEQIRVILAHLKTRILKQSQEYIPNYQEEEPAKDVSDGFSRLLLLIFGHTTASLASVLNCPHTKYSRYFRRKLKCDSPTFNVLCSEMASKIAERNYQFEIFNIQIGSIANTAIAQSGNPLAEEIAQLISREQDDRRKGVVPTCNKMSQPSVQELQAARYEEMPAYWISHPQVVQFPWVFGNHPPT